MNPDQFTISEQWLKVGAGHQLYLQDWGNKIADQPIIYLHGGPGSGLSDRNKQAFDPVRQRVIFFDQRGAGKSRFTSLLKDNTTDDLVDDISKIADSLNVPRFSLYGGSWGSTLALVYAIRHSDRVAKLYLHGVFCGQQSEIDYLDQGGYRQFFPDVWKKYQASVPLKYQNDPTTYHYSRILGKDNSAAKISAYAYATMEGSLVTLDQRPSMTSWADFDPSGNIIEAHYLKNKLFLECDYIFKQASKLTMPVYLIQGRYDAVCPPVTAYQLAEKLPDGRLIWTMAGHSGGDRSYYDVIRGLLAG